jgi:hypothetical protein
MSSGETDSRDVPDSALTRDEVIARNLVAVDAHFHNENLFREKGSAADHDSVPSGAHVEICP